MKSSLNKEKLIIAHRGTRGLTSTENSYEAFDKTLDLGGEWVELDVRKTKDEKFIAFHDENIDGEPVSSMSFIEIKEKRKEIETLEDILSKYKNKLKFDIEIKEEGDEEKILKIVKKYLFPKDFFISSFSEETLLKVKGLAPEVKTGLLIDKNKNIIKKFFSFFPEKKLKKVKADFVIAHYSTTKLLFFQRMKHLKIPVFVWTVNSEKKLKKLLKKSLDGIITDRPDRGLKIKREGNITVPKNFVLEKGNKIKYFERTGEGEN